MPEQISGLFLFLMYTGVCVEYRRMAGLISQDDDKKISRLLKEKVAPEVDFLEHCFPIAVRDYRECSRCKEEGINPDFSFYSVSNHWRKHHGGKTPVHAALVIFTLIEIMVGVLDDREMIVDNPYLWDIDEQSRVTVHNNSIIEVIE